MAPQNEFTRGLHPVYSSCVLLSIVIITYNEESNLDRTLESVRALVLETHGEIIVVDSGSTDRTIEIAKSFGAKVYLEAWKGYAAQKNSALEKASGDWILSLDADEELDPELQKVLPSALEAISSMGKLSSGLGAHAFMREDAQAEVRKSIGIDYSDDLAGVWLRRKNLFLGRWMKHGGFWPDAKLRLFRRGAGKFEDRLVHEDLHVTGRTGEISAGTLVHHSYPTLSSYIEHMERYSSLGAEMALTKGPRGFSLLNIVVRPWLTFKYNYFLRLGFLDGREGLLLHLYHSVYVSWKYAKVWELSKKRSK